MIKKKSFVKRFLLYIITIFFSLIALFPFYWLFVTSLQPIKILYQSPPTLLPVLNPIKEFYNFIINEKVVFLWLRNTLIVSTIATIFSTLFGTLGAYAISRFKFKGKIHIIFLTLVTQMMPPAFLIITIYILFSRLHLNNHLYTLIITYTALTTPITIWFLKGFMDTIPVELEEAALIDGCSRIGSLIKILIPTIVPGIIATSAWSFMICWNEFLFAYTLVSPSKFWNISVGLASYLGAYAVDWDTIMKAAIFATLPTIIIFMFLQKFIVSGITAGSVKE
jgi:multiple sugar transport system permease protein